MDANYSRDLSMQLNTSLQSVTGFVIKEEAVVNGQVLSGNTLTLMHRFPSFSLLKAKMLNDVFCKLLITENKNCGIH